MFTAFVGFSTNRSLLSSSRLQKGHAVCRSHAGRSKFRMTQTRIGHGFDLHRLEPGLPLILGGVRLKHDRGCAGHSDGDAVYHCVVDAILGALSLPDIGQLFPDTDPQFKDCASHVFMEAAYEKMQQRGYRVSNLDVTIILERPKMAPHKAIIRENIARLMHTHVDNINVKAKTHEKVDAVGENRAVSVHAVVMLAPNGLQNDSSSQELVESAPLKTGESVTNSLLGMIGQRVSAVQDLTIPDKQVPCPVQRLYDTVEERKDADPSSSWTAKLFSKGHKKIAQKVGEEAVEVAIEGSARHPEGVVKESADLLYHLTVLWASLGIKPGDVWSELAHREGTSGITEKASRSG